MNEQVKTITSGMITAQRGTYTHGVPEKHGQKRCCYVINTYCIEHPTEGTIMIDAGFSKDFCKRPPYGNLNVILKAFQKMNGVTYAQLNREDTLYQLSDMGKEPKQVFLTHLHPDHTSALEHMSNDTVIHYGKGEDTFYYKLLAGKHIKGKKVKLINFEKGVSKWGFDKVIDLFGDDSFYAISTKGHTKDHISYLLKAEDKMHFFVGDAELTKEDVRMGFYVNSDYGKKGEAHARESADVIRQFTKDYPEAMIYYSHDL